MPSVITWVSSPVQPGETAIVTGGSFATNAIVRISRLGDGTPTTLVSKASDPVTIKWAETKPIHRTATSIYFVVPGDLTMGLYSVQVVDSNGTSNTAYINRVEPMWFQGTRGAGSTIAPGEELRVFGKSINLNDIRSAPPTIAGVEDYQVQLSEAMASLDTAPATPTTPTTPTSPRSDGHEELTQSTYMRMSRPKATPLEHEHDWTDAAAELSAHHEEVHEAEKCILHEQPEEPSYDIEFIKGDEKAASQDETNVAILRATSYLKLIPTSSSQGSARVISFSAVSSYDGRVTLPTSLPLGKWTVAVNNGYGGNSGWANCPDTLTVAAKPGDWPTKTFDVVALGGLANAINAANNNKGGIVVVPTGRFVISSQIKVEPRVLIKGAGMDRTSIVWEFKSNTPPDSIFQGSGFAIEQLNIYANGPFNNCFRGSRSTEPTRFSYVRFRANPFMKVYVGPQPVPDDANLKTKAVFNFVADDLTVNNCDIYAPNYAFYLDSGENVRIYNNVINFGGQGYSFICNRKMIFENNALYGCSFESVGNGISSLSLGQNLKRSENLYYANNRHEHNYGNNREMITLDGSGGAYYGYVASASGNAVTLAGNLNPQPGGMPSNVKATWTGAVMVILSGQGAGQYRRILSNEGRVIKLESAFAIQPNSSSRVQITFFRGNYLIIGNSFQDGGATQLYGCSFNCVVARNLFYRTGGFACWGLNPGNYGYQPTMYNEICDNQIVEGNAWATIASQFMTLGHGTNKDEPMARYLAWRRNTINNNGNFSITHATDDCLYEKNRIADTTTAFASSGNIFGPSVIFRGNITSNVKNLHQGTGSGIFKFL